MFVYIFAFLILLAVITGYFSIARYFSIVDKPNRRSSHSYETILGGGIIFPVAALLWFLIYGFPYPWILISLLLLTIVSFIDDLKTLSTITRILVHFSAVAILLWQTGLLDYQWYIIVLVFLFVTGWLNAFNFMDGINGITALYAFTSLLTFAWLNNTVDFVSQEVIIFLIISVVIFAFFNARRFAKTFAGDVGSISMAFLLAWFMILLIVKTGIPEYILLFSVYGIDTVITIIIRLVKRENIFEAHRTHLYQLLSNELSYPHLFVAVTYSFVQLFINVFIIMLISKNKMNIATFILTLFSITLIYLLLRLKIFENIQTKKD